MLKSLLISLCLTLLTVFYSCDKEDEKSEKSDQILNVFLEYSDNAYDAENDSIIVGPFTRVSGFLAADPVPKMLEVKVNGRLVFDKFIYSDGRVSFFDESAYFGAGKPIPFTSGLHLVAVKTSLGEITGQIIVPKQITGVNFSPAGSMLVNQPLTISWQGSNADFYEVGFYYNGFVDTLVKGTSVTFQGKYFRFPGALDNIWIYPVNGPFPEENTKGNLTGAGNGSLFYIGKSFDWEGYFVIGPGTENRLSVNQNGHQIRELRQRLHRKLQMKD